MEQAISSPHFLQSPKRSWLARLLLGRPSIDDLEIREPDLISSACFRAELEREMHRADRTGSPLTLVVFDVRMFGGGRRAREARRRALEILARIVTVCSRRTDLRGWLREGSSVKIGLILGDTPAEKARGVIEKIRRSFAAHPTEHLGPNDLFCEIYGYAGEQMAPSADGPQQLWLFDPSTLAGLADGHPSDSVNGSPGREFGRRGQSAMRA